MHSSLSVTNGAPRVSEVSRAIDSARGRAPGDGSCGFARGPSRSGRQPR